MKIKPIVIFIIVSSQVIDITLYEMADFTIWYTFLCGDATY